VPTFFLARFLHSNYRATPWLGTFSHSLDKRCDHTLLSVYGLDILISGTRGSQPARGDPASLCHSPTGARSDAEGPASRNAILSRGLYLTLTHPTGETIMKTYFLRRFKTRLYLKEIAGNTVKTFNASTVPDEMRIVEFVDDWQLNEFTITKKGLDWNCIGSTSDPHGTMGVVDRDYLSPQVRLLDIINDMSELLESAAETAIRG
jgi:hypothetical protein